MDLDRQVCDRARRARDARFDGRFFIAVTSTRVYCRPICPARSPKDENVHYFATAAAAAAAGYPTLPALQARSAPGSPAWLGTSSVVSRALRLIGDGALDQDGVERLADRLGVTSRHLRRLFLRHVGATPLDVAQTRRLHFAKKLLDETALPMPDVALAAGFGSVRRFNSEMQRTYRRTPTHLRRLARRREPAGPGSYRLLFERPAPPYDWPFVLGFLQARATPGIESVCDGHYRRTLQIDGQSGEIDVSWIEAPGALSLEVKFPDPRALLSIVERVRRMFDVNADPAVIAAHLGERSAAGAAACRACGHSHARSVGRLRAGRARDSRSTDLGPGRNDARRTSRDAVGHGRRRTVRDSNRLFPSATALAQAPLEEAGVMPSRAATIRALARRVVAGAFASIPPTAWPALRRRSPRFPASATGRGS